MKSWQEVKDSIGKHVKKTQKWITNKIYSGVDLQEQITFASDIALHNNRYLTVFFLVLVKIAYRIETAIMGLLGII